MCLFWEWKADYANFFALSRLWEIDYDYDHADNANIDPFNEDADNANHLKDADDANHLKVKDIR